MMNIYIGCALTHVPRDSFAAYAEFVHKLASTLKAGRHEVHYALIDSDPQLAEKPIEERARLCYLWDRSMVEAADVLIADVSYPSLGLGIELQVAESVGVPIVLSFLESGKMKAPPVHYRNPDTSTHELQIGEGYVSLMALGLPEIVRVIRYSDYELGISAILEAVELLSK